MNPTDHELMTRGLAKLDTPEILTAAEREVLAFYGSESTRDRIITKEIALRTNEAAADPPPSKPSARPVSRKELRQGLQEVIGALGPPIKKALADRDAKIAEVTRVSADAAITMREEIRALTAQVEDLKLQLDADRDARSEVAR
jgi:hypothetical protein